MYLDHSPQDNDLATTVLCTAAGVIGSTVAMTLNVIRVNEFSEALFYAASSAVVAYVTKLGLDYAKNKISEWYKNRKTK